MNHAAVWQTYRTAHRMNFFYIAVVDVQCQVEPGEAVGKGSKEDVPTKQRVGRAVHDVRVQTQRVVNFDEECEPFLVMQCH